MFQDVQIEGFKCFQSVQLKRLRRVNVIVGGNASGKTALLEALFIMSGGSSNLVWRTNLWRGNIHSKELHISSSEFRDVWRDLFHLLDTDKKIFVQAKDNKKGLRSLSISFAPEESERSLDLDSSEIYQPIEFVWTVNRRKFTIRVALPQATKELRESGDLKIEPWGATFLSPLNPHPQDDIRRFSLLSKTKALGPVLEALSEEFQLIRNLSLGKHLGQDTVFADVSNLSEMVPIGSVSAGSKRFLSILLSIATASQGIVLIDELENGFHFSHYESIWRRIANWGEGFSCQLFVSTHNRECLEALIPTAKTNPQWFSLVRLERGNGSSTIRQFTAGDLLAALEEEVEIR